MTRFMRTATFGLDLPTFPCAASVKDGKWIIIIGYSDEDKFLDIDDIVDKLKRLGDQFDHGNWEIPQKKKGKLGFEIEARIGGYLEGYFNRNGKPICEYGGGFYHLYASKSTFSKGCIIPGTTIPVFLEGSGIITVVNGQLGLGLTTNGEIKADVDFLGSGELSVGLGVGVPEVLAGSGGLSGNIDFSTKYMRSIANKFMGTYSLKGYIKVNILTLSYVW